MAASTFMFWACPSSAQYVSQTNLVTDNQEALADLGFTAAAFVDPNLINPWGMSFVGTSPFWVSDQGTNVSTLYRGDGSIVPLVVSTPVTVSGPQGPTGQVGYGGSGFLLSNGQSGRFFFANLNGTISAWNSGFGTSAQTVATTPGAVYTGLASGTIGTANFLYAANDSMGRIDVFDDSFSPVNIPGGFVDPGSNPDNLVPFNIANIGDRLFVSYAPGGPDADESALGTGFVSEFMLDGTFVRRVTDGGPLASPWGMTLAPSSFGDFAGSLLVGNFNEDHGQINAFDLGTGAFLGSLLNPDGSAVTIPYLWQITPGNDGNAGSSQALFFAAGIGDEEHGLLGRFDAVAVPEATSWAMMIAGFGMIGAVVRRRGKAERALSLSA
ncbi:TIGR03118 family protein [Sphingomonas sp. JC676]|uniref:TIGR03118 family protein n=1 Tax=Sphingomonas sp. JC676 TaxID=2768065 RepID=UPI0016585E64|nr:TIGR03118 family protein [Sphingomonas sp. JC676]MBC9033173.1 TIGR03118 family protein [Sphingomonas sp. JC676]